MTDPAISSDAATVIETLGEVEARLGQLPKDAKHRELSTAARKYKHLLGAWQSEKPSASKRRALIELVQELRDRVASDAPSVRTRDE